MSARLRGHALRDEGAAYAIGEAGRPIRVHNWTAGAGGPGRALCQCGAMSDPLASANQRRKWHREHKADLIEHGGVA